MSFLRRTVQKRFPATAKLGDVMIVGNAGLRFAHRQGWIDDDMAKRFGAASGSGGTGLSATELALIAGAALRIVGRARSKKA